MKAAKLKGTIKWLVYILTALLLFCLQSAPVKIGLLDDILYLLPLAVAFSCYEKTLTSAVFSTVCGLFWDYCSQRQFGYSALFLCVFCTVVSLIMNYYIHPIYISAFIACVSVAAIYTVIDFFFFFVIRGYTGLGKLFVTQYLPVFVKTSVLSAVICFVVEKIYKINPYKASFDK